MSEGATRSIKGFQMARAPVGCSSPECARTDRGGLYDVISQLMATLHDQIYEEREHRCPRTDAGAALSRFLNKQKTDRNTITHEIDTLTDMRPCLTT